jgi:beta-barrel assembly-enhancing protease
VRSVLLLLVLAATPAAVATIELVSVKDEIAIGREAQQQVKAKLPEVGGDVLAYVAGVGRRLTARARGPKYPYTFSIADYREINAFALPGGPVWINRGIIAAATNEAQLASVLAHEIAHIAQRHAADQMTKQLVANGLLGLLGAFLGNDGGGAKTAQMAAQVLAGGYMMKFSRDDEREADRVGAQIMSRAGWDARAMIEFFDTLRKQQGRDPHSVEVFLSTHPAPAERANLLRAQLRGASGGRRDSQAFQHTKARVAKMAAARRMPR